MFVFNHQIEYSWKYYVKRFLLPFFDLFYLIILKISNRTKSDKKFNVVICTIFKDEAIYLKEWIEYHKIVGVEHFYMYNNFSSDNFKEVLNVYIEQNIVTLIDWPIQQGQFSAYQHWSDNFKCETQWVSFLDPDEFICPIFELSIVDWVKKFRNFPCIVMYWRMFGTSGKIRNNCDMLVTEQYTICWDKLYTVGKVLYNTDYDIAIFDFAVHHATKTKVRIYGINIIIPPINEFKYFLRWDIHRVGNHLPDDFTIQVNHYWSKSFMTYYAKTLKSDVAFIVNPKNMDYFLWHERHNKSTDFKIFRFIIQLKDSLGLISREQ